MEKRSGFRQGRGNELTAFEIPTVATARSQLRAFCAGDLGAAAAIEATSKVMRHLLTGSAAACGVS